MEISIAAVCGLCLLFCVGGFLASYIYFRRKIVDFTDEVCESAQEILRQSQGLRKLTLDNDTFENTGKSRFFERRTSRVLY